MEIDNEAQLRREIGERFRRARKNARNGRGFRQDEVAAALGKGDGTVSTWETGRALPDALILRWMALNYGVSVDELLLLKEPGSPVQQPLLPTPQTEPSRPPVAKPAGQRADTIELPVSDLVHVIQEAVANGLSEEREVRAFLSGVVAGARVNR
jgi:transcriptional regulator with XRE-family HTH domain